MKDWKEYTIGQLCEVGRGSSPRPIVDQRYFQNGNIPWIKIADATASGKYIYETKEYVNEYGASFSRYLEPNSLIIAASGTLGQINFLGVNGCIHDGWLYLSSYKDELIDKEYLYHFFKTIGKEFENLSYGAAIQNINTTILRNIKVVLPPLPTQQRIASILSAYDDLIAINNQRIKLLEQTARELYKEWFVRMRFPATAGKPGYKQAKFKKGIPVGWHLDGLYDVAELTYGFPFDSTVFNETGNGIPLIRIRDLVEGITKTFTPEIADEKYYANDGDILIGMDGDFHFCKWADVKAWINQRNVRIKPKKNFLVSNYFLYHATKPHIEFLNEIIVGTTVAHLSARDLRKIKLLIPTDDLLEKFKKIVDPIYEQEIILKKQNTQLRQIRDRLLPRLISGKLQVSEL